MYNLWSHVYKVWVQAKLIYCDKNQISACLQCGVELTTKWQKGTFWNDDAVYLKWAGGEREVYTCQNSTVHLKCVHVILCKLDNKVDKKAKLKKAEGTIKLYNSVINCQMTTYFSSHWEVKYCIPDLGWPCDFLCSREYLQHVTTLEAWKGLAHQSLPACCSWNPETTMWIGRSRLAWQMRHTRPKDIKVQW